MEYFFIQFSKIVNMGQQIFLSFNFKKSDSPLGVRGKSYQLFVQLAQIDFLCIIINLPDGSPVIH